MIRFNKVIEVKVQKFYTEVILDLLFTDQNINLNLIFVSISTKFKAEISIHSIRAAVTPINE